MSAKKAASGITEDLLRKQGYAPNADGSWSRAGPPAGGAGNRPDPQQPAKRKLEGKPRPPGPDARSDGQGIGKFLVIATVHSVRPRDYDGLGAAVKGIIDRLVELNRIPIPDDSPEYLEVVCDWVKCAGFKDQKTIIECWKLPE